MLKRFVVTLMSLSFVVSSVKADDDSLSIDVASIKDAAVETVDLNDIPDVDSLVADAGTEPKTDAIEACFRNSGYHNGCWSNNRRSTWYGNYNSSYCSPYSYSSYCAPQQYYPRCRPQTCYPTTQCCPSWQPRICYPTTQHCDPICRPQTCYPTWNSQSTCQTIYLPPTCETNYYNPCYTTNFVQPCYQTNYVQPIYRNNFVQPCHTTNYVQPCYQNSIPPVRHHNSVACSPSHNGSWGNF